MPQIAPTMQRRRRSDPARLIQQARLYRMMSPRLTDRLVFTSITFGA
jgi:hypothetical protein